MKLFSVDGGFYRFMCKLIDVVKLSFLWLLFSLPIITAGASTVAAMYVALKMADDEEGYIGRQFIKGFKDNWKKATLLWLITAVAVYAIYLDFQIFEAAEGNPMIFLIIGIASIILAVSATLYSYPLLARYENTLFRTIQNSIDITRKYMGRTLQIVILVFFEVILFQLHISLMFIGLIFGPGFIIYTIAALSKRIFLEIEKEPGSVTKPDEDRKELGPAAKPDGNGD